MGTLNALDQMIAEHACARQIMAYAAAVDAADWQAVAALYTATGRMSRPTAPDVFIAGRATILASLVSRPPRVTRHVCANIRVTLSDADNATASSQILLFTGKDQPPLVGSYADVLVREDGDWRFAERRGSLDFI